MASYIDSTLTKDEKVIHKGKISVWSLTHWIIAGIFFSYILYGLGVFFLIAAAIRYFCTELVITNKRILVKFGFISRSTVEIKISRIESIQINQGIFGRIFNFGSIYISGAGNPLAPIPGISKPLEFRREFIEAQEANKNL